MQAAGDHQVKNEPQIVFQTNRDALADTLQLAHFTPFDAGDGRIYSAQQERACQPHMFERLTDNARLQRGDVSGNVGEIRHRLQIARH